MKILVTGAAGFIGYHVCDLLISEKKNIVFGVDNLDDYYDVKLKKDRIKELTKKSKKKFDNFKFLKKDILNFKLSKFVKKNKITHIIHLAAQAGVRYSILHPGKYFKTNVEGTKKLLNVAKDNKIKHLILASTSSVYGKSNKKNFEEHDDTNRPIQFYAATKKTNEIMAYSYSAIYNTPITVIRFFTVYGPWGRPDMALFKFTKNILLGNKIELYNYGVHNRSFSYIGDVKKYVKDILFLKFKKSEKIKFRIINVGSPNSVNLKKFLKIISISCKKKPKIILKSLQKGDVVSTKANINYLLSLTKKKYETPLKIGIKNFVSWYQNYSKNNR